MKKFKYTVYHGHVPFQPHHTKTWKEATDFMRDKLKQGFEIHSVTIYNKDFWELPECE